MVKSLCSEILCNSLDYFPLPNTVLFASVCNLPGITAACVLVVSH